MTTIGSINGISGTAPIGSGSADPRQAAHETIGEIGQRVLAWVGASGGGGDRAALAADTGVQSDFVAEARDLARGGDVYDLDGMTRDLTARFGGTPAEEGGLRRSLENFTRQAVVQLAGLSGASAERQFAGIRDALAQVGDVSAQGGLDGVTARLDSATAVLARQNGD